VPHFSLIIVIYIKYNLLNKNLKRLKKCRKTNTFSVTEDTELIYLDIIELSKIINYYLDYFIIGIIDYLQYMVGN
jgi:hypothetical protein